MFRRAALSILFVTLQIYAVSQNFQGGVTGGLNAARIDGDGHELWGKFGLNAGAFVSRAIMPEILYWQMELKYSARGKYQGPTIADPGIEIIDLKYAEMPLSLQYFINDRISAEFGFAPDVLLKAEYADENGFISPDYASELRTFGITVLGGLSYDVLERISIGIRFNYSVFPFYKFDAYAVRYRDTGFFHDVLSINMKYYFIKN
ncbi:MAG: PorT family protein [Bacteroidales bacterium]|nr:PorT family protein [Bacteroidales bacterium]